MSYPSIDEFLVKLNCILAGLIASLVVSRGVELVSAICCSDQVNDSFIAAVTKLDGTPGCLVENSLPYVFAGVSRTIHDSSVTEDDGGLILFKCDLDEDIFKGHLHLHDVDLEPNGVCEGELTGLDHGTSFHQKSGCFRHEEHSETKLLENCAESC